MALADPDRPKYEKNKITSELSSFREVIANVCCVSHGIISSFLLTDLIFGKLVIFDTLEFLAIWLHGICV